MLCFGSPVSNTAGSHTREQSPALTGSMTLAWRRRLAKHAPALAIGLLALIGAVQGIVLARLSSSPGSASLEGHGRGIAGSVSLSREDQPPDERATARETAGVTAGPRP